MASGRRSSTDRASGFASSESPQAPEGDELPDWYADNVRGLVDALSTMDTDGIWPTWAGDRPGRSTRAGWPRRPPCTAGTRVGGAIDPALAVDGIDEHLELFAPLAPGDAPRASHGTIHLHATDVDGEWLVTLGPDGITFEHGHAKGDVALRGTASDLLLWAWNRVPVDDRFEVFGDPRLLDAWRTGGRDLTLRDRRRPGRAASRSRPPRVPDRPSWYCATNSARRGSSTESSGAGEPTPWRPPPRPRSRPS